jgi:hypothetical protein
MHKTLASWPMMLLAILVIHATAARRAETTFFPNVNNIYGPDGLNRDDSNTSHLLGKVKSPEDCRDKCIAAFPDTCFSFTHYSPDSPDTDHASSCFAVTTSYYDYFPGLQFDTQVVSGRVWHGCKSNLDCAQNGLCSADGSCSCNSGWKGDGCTELDLLPTIRNAGYQYSTDGVNVSSWGGVPHGPDSNGLYHMWVSQMTKHCGIIAWGENSIIVHTVRYFCAFFSCARSTTYLSYHPASLRLRIV